MPKQIHTEQPPYRTAKKAEKEQGRLADSKFALDGQAFIPIKKEESREVDNDPINKKGHSSSFHQNSVHFREEGRLFPIIIQYSCGFDNKLRVV